jgi:3-hydroxyacyl-[acyl-carrier-protein] dehydratase
MSDLLDEALRLLPHGPEFRFLDRLTSLDPGRTGTGEYKLRGDEAFLSGHFPGQPVMPGVLLLEAAAQIAGTVAQSDPQVAPLRELKLTAVRGAKILGTARPGETVVTKAEVIGRMKNLIQARATATVGGRLMLQVELTLSGETPADPS